jgi:formylglycine-generating enzyme
MYWMKRAYGVNSNEYKSILPDSNQWLKLNIDYSTLDTCYFKHKEFRGYPVIGVSNEQAKKYSKWRSDRVMSYMLVAHGIIKLKTDIKDSLFTTEKYFAGNYYSIKPNSYFSIYPVYSLPDSTINTTTGFRNICTYKKVEIK